MEKNHNPERERELNKRYPVLSRPASSLDSHSPGSFSHPKTNSLSRQQTHEDTQTPPILTPPTHQMLHSFSGPTRAGSPDGSSVGSHDTTNESQEENIIHKRERSWNATRKKWSRHGHGSDSPSRGHSPPPASSHLRDYPNGRHKEAGLPKARTTKEDKLRTTTETSVANGSNSRGAPLPSSSQPTMLSMRTSPTSTSSQRSTSRKQNEAHLRTHSPPSRSKENGSSPATVMISSTSATMEELRTVKISSRGSPTINHFHEEGADKLLNPRIIPSD